MCKFKLVILYFTLKQRDVTHLVQKCFFRFQGEFYMDREHGNLYVWFPSNNNGKITETDLIYVSLINNCIQ